MDILEIYSYKNIFKLMMEPTILMMELKNWEQLHHETLLSID